MSRDELLAELATALARVSGEDAGERMRDQLAPCLPAIVAFVSDWLIASATMDNGDVVVALEAQWSAEMGAPIEIRGRRAS